MSRPGFTRTVPVILCALACAVCVMVLICWPSEPPPKAPEEARPRRVPAGHTRVTVADRYDAKPDDRVVLEIAWDDQAVTWEKGWEPTDLPGPSAKELTNFAGVILLRSNIVNELEKRGLRGDRNQLTQAEFREVYGRAEEEIRNALKSRFGIVTRVRLRPVEE